MSPHVIRSRGWLGLAVSLALLLVMVSPAGAQWAATWIAKGDAPSPPFGPGPRGWVDMTFDEVSNRVALLGGSGGSYFNDVLLYDGAANAWTTVEPYSLCFEINDHVPPTGRDEHAVEYDSFNRLYWMFGGSGFACKGSVRIADAGTTTTAIVDAALSSSTVDAYKDWTAEVIASGAKAIVSAYDPVAKRLTLSTPLAGLTTATPYYVYPQRGGGTWYYSPVTGEWASLSGPHWGYTGPSPSSRLSPAMAYSPVDRVMVMFGGDAGSGRNDTWVIDVETKSWVQMIPHGAPGSPPPLRQITNSMVYDRANDVFILFGGRMDSGGASDQTWAYRVSTNTWTRLLPAVSPSSREQHTLAYDSDNGVTVLFGGSGLADTWVFDYPTTTWTPVTPAVSPPGRRIAAMVYDPANGVTVLYGGLTGTTSLGDVWHLQLIGGAGHPVPSLTSLSPASQPEGSVTFTLTVDGSGFASSSAVRWNGAARPTTFVNPTRLRATIPDTDVAAEGTATVTVFTPAPGGGESNPLTFVITSPALPGEIILDNLPAGAQDGARSFTGAWCGSGGVAPYGGDSLYSCGTGGDTYRWRPTIAATGAYDVFVWWTSHPMRSTTVPITVTHAGGTTTRTFNEQNPGGTWVLHGQYTFNAGTTGFVQVSDVNGQAAADAARFVAAALPANPVPALISLSPPSIVVGSPAFTLTVNGSGFVPTSVVRWNGLDRVTTYVSPSQVTAGIGVDDIAAPGTPGVTVFNPSPGGGLSNTLPFTIDPPALPTVTIAAATPTATEAGPTAGSLTVTRAGSPALPLIVSYTVGGTATPGSDYATLPGTVIIPVGQATAPIPVTPIDDPAVEPAETVVVTLGPGLGYTVGSPPAATVTIVSNDGASEIILDNLPAGDEDAARTFTGSWCLSGGIGPLGTDSLYSCGAGLDTYRWTPAIPAAGAYDVSVWWTAHPNRSTAVPISVAHAGGITTRIFNEQTPGGTWVLHGRYSFDTGTDSYIEVSDANGQAAADAVRLVAAPAAAEIVLDNLPVGAEDATRTFTGAWCPSGGIGPFGATSLYSCGPGLDTYRWTATIATAGDFDVYVWWSAHPMRSTTVPISVTHAGGTTTRTFNEQVGGGAWVLHGRYSLDVGAQGYVEVSDANGQAAADAVRFVPVP